MRGGRLEYLMEHMPSREAMKTGVLVGLTVEVIMHTKDLSLGSHDNEAKILKQTADNSKALKKLIDATEKNNLKVDDIREQLDNLAKEVNELNERMTLYTYQELISKDSIPLIGVKKDMLLENFNEDVELLQNIENVHSLLKINDQIFSLVQTDLTIDPLVDLNLIYNFLL